jgi:hypothetical protein
VDLDASFVLENARLKLIESQSGDDKIPRRQSLAATASTTKVSSTTNQTKMINLFISFAQVQNAATSGQHGK